MFEDFFKTATDFGLKYGETKLGLNPDVNKTKETAEQNQELQKKYDQLLQSSTKQPVIVQNPISKNMLIGGAVALIATFLVIKG